MKTSLLCLILLFASPPLEARRSKKGWRGESFSSSSSGLDSILDIFETNYTTLAQALNDADLEYTYDCTRRCRDVTFFAPSNAAFAALDPTTLAKLKDPMYKEHLVQLLEYHVVKGELEASEISNGTQYRTVQRERINATVSGSTIQLNGAATVVKADIKALNGIVHEIDSVLLPSFITSNLVDVLRSKSEFSTLVAAIDAVDGLAAMLGTGNYTLFAPTNRAFERLTTMLSLNDTAALTNILSYHVIPDVLIEKYDFDDGFLTTLNGRDIEVDVRRRKVELNDDADVDDFNILASNGIIHEIDRVLMPPAPLVDIAATASARSDLTTLMIAIGNDSLLVDFFQASGPFTCFLPTNSAFDKLPSSVLLALQTNATTLSSTLRYHCVSGTYMRSNFTSGRLTSLEGSDIEIDCRSRNRIRLNDDADVDDYDIRATNGIIHLIDKVLEIPAPLLSIADYLATDNDFDTLNILIQAAGLDSALGGPGNFTLFAPQDRAFDRLGSTNLLMLQNNATALKDILSYHVVTDELFQNELKDGVVKASNGVNLRIDVTNSGKRAYLNGWIKVKEFDIACTNGVIHGIRNVLTVPQNLYASLQSNGLTTLAAAIDAVDGLRQTLETGEFTLFAPDNDAFEDVTGLSTLLTQPDTLKALLEYHLLPGTLLAGDLVEGSYTTVQGSSIEIDHTRHRYWMEVNDVGVRDLNNLSSNGVIHVIKDVLSLPSGITGG